MILASLAGIGGSFVGSLTFLLGATNVPAIFGKQDPAVLNTTLVKTVGWSSISMVVGIMAIVGLVMGFWANNKVSNIS